MAQRGEGRTPRASKVAAILRLGFGVASFSGSASSEGAGWYADSGVVVAAAAAAAAAAPETVEDKWASWMSSILIFGVSFLMDVVLCSLFGGVVSFMVTIVSRFVDDSFLGVSVEAMSRSASSFLERDV